LAGHLKLWLMDEATVSILVCRGLMLFSRWYDVGLDRDVGSDDALVVILRLRYSTLVCYSDTPKL
jgi:hypothetical protein